MFRRWVNGDKGDFESGLFSLESAVSGMPKHPQFAPTKTSGGWMVSIPANMTESGERVRRYFASADLAHKFATGLRRDYHRGQRGGVISLELALMAESATAMLEPHGATIIDAARDFVKRAEAAKSDETFGERYMTAMLDGEMRWSNRYRMDMDRLPGWVGPGIMSELLDSLTPEMIASALRANGAVAQSTIQSRARYVSAIRNYAPRHRKKEGVDIMSVSQCAQMLRSAESPAERYAVALLLFAGIRPSAEDGEISRLDWSAVGNTEIYVAASVSKTGTDRHIKISPRLARLLRGHPESGPVIPANWRRVYQRLRNAVTGIAGKQDVTRHTFASNHLAAFGEDKTKAAMGHSDGSRTLFRHYRKSVTEEAGKKFFR